MELAIGGPVYAQEQECGRLEMVVLNPETIRVWLLVVNRRDRQLAAPFGAVVEASAHEGTRLDLVDEDCDSLPTYEVRGLATPAEGWGPPELEPDEEIIPAPIPHVADAPALPPLLFVPSTPLVEVNLKLGPEQSVEVGAFPVEATDGEVGNVSRIGVDGSGQLLHLVVHETYPMNREIVVPLSAVKIISRGRIELRLNRHEVARLPSNAA